MVPTSPAVVPPSEFPKGNPTQLFPLFKAIAHVPKSALVPIRKSKS